jgi:hypothetical protein
MRLAVSAFAVASLCAVPAMAQSDRSANTETRDTRPQPPMLGKHLAKGQSKPGGGGGRQLPNLTYHNGPVMTVATEVHPIFWGNSWTDANFVGDKETGLASFYNGVGGSSYLSTNTEYTQSGGAHVLNAVNHPISSSVDTSNAPSGAPSTGAILAEVCAVIGSNVKSNGYYPVYVDTKRGNTGYCAWHSWGTCGTTNVQFAFFFNLDNDPGCDPQDNVNGHSQGLASLSNVSGHELSEMLTDPRGTGWYDRQGAENSDKCAWTFGGPTLVFSNNSAWKVQGNWSNIANNNGQGYVDGSLVRGCIDGTNNP